jgi:anthranilate synthase component II
MIAVIDNYDSFTWNLVDFLRRGHQVVSVFRNDEVTPEEVVALSPKGILISPGPGRPEDSGISLELMLKVAGKIPVLGVCLGHQLIGQHFGMPLRRGLEPVHGKTSLVFHRGTGLFRSLPSPFAAMRYHSLVLSDHPLPAQLVVTAWTGAGEVMAIRHVNGWLEGIQFHPESILTEGGEVLLRNWIERLD